MNSTDATACPHCGWPDGGEPFQVLSRHATATGRTEWTRCGCGSLQVRVVDGAGALIAPRAISSLAAMTPWTSGCAWSRFDITSR
ncbi:hypothetical protein ABZ322_37085, partial [Streptomyces sp. NPDC006129]|uniref:hypothetical protein n=1 Tax=Streptomyces sp. NPDC006129 TaxID=3155348 RepID=UPI0033AC1BC2